MFRFKQFIVDDSLCAMKVTTDGVLLGAWAGADRQPDRVLDIGTGSGLIALMLAQRFSEAHLTAIDIDPMAAAQASQNFKVSPWAERLTAKHCSLQDFGSQQKFSLIVSNPPYFQNALRNPDMGKATARHADSLSYKELVTYAADLLTSNGSLALVLPAQEEDGIIRLADACSLRPVRLCRVRGKNSKPFKRILVEFSHTDSDASLSQSALTLTDETGNRTADYAALTRDFYL